jgi:hypothetical protein
MDWLPISIRKYNSRLQSEIPDEIAQGLKPRDIAFWKREADGTCTVRFGKLEKLIEPTAMTECT